MTYRQDDDVVDERPGLRLASSMIRIALLFSSAGIAFALIMAPIADRLLRDSGVSPHGIDYTSTSATNRSVSYTVRRSVLQEKGGTCIIRSDGRSFGSC